MMAAGTLQINLGRLIVSEVDVGIPIKLDGGFSLQPPQDSNEENVLWFSRHGDIHGVWFRLMGEEILTFEPPMFVYSDKPCAIPIMYRLQ